MYGGNLKEREIYLIGDVEQMLAEMDFSDVADDFAEIDEALELWISGWVIRIPSLGIGVRKGVACLFNEEAKMFIPEYDVTVICKENIEGTTNDNTENILWFMKDDIVVTLENWLDGRVPIAEIEQLECYMEIANITK